MSGCRHVALDDASAGMVLAGDLRDHQGTVLLARGAVLSDAQLAALRRRGVASVPVVDDGVPAPELEAARERLAARLAHLYRKPPGGPADVLLRELVAAYRTEQLQ